VFSDGVIYIYEKDVPYDPNEKYDKAIVQTSTNNGDSAAKDGKNFSTKAEIVLKMQEIVEDFDFQQLYKADTQGKHTGFGEAKQCLYEK